MVIGGKMRTSKAMVNRKKKMIFVPRQFFFLCHKKKMRRKRRADASPEREEFSMPSNSARQGRLADMISNEFGDIWDGGVNVHFSDRGLGEAPRNHFTFMFLPVHYQQMKSSQKSLLRHYYEWLHPDGDVAQYMKAWREGLLNIWFEASDGVRQAYFFKNSLPDLRGFNVPNQRLAVRRAYQNIDAHHDLMNWLDFLHVAHPNFCHTGGEYQFYYKTKADDPGLYGGFTLERLPSSFTGCGSKVDFDQTLFFDRSGIYTENDAEGSRMPFDKEVSSDGTPVCIAPPACFAHDATVVNTIRQCTHRFWVGALLIVMRQKFGRFATHLNGIVVDTVANTLTRFEPRGQIDYREWNEDKTLHVYDASDLDTQLSAFAQREFGYRYISPLHFCSVQGPQLHVEKFPDSKQRVEGRFDRGWCRPLSLMFLHRRLMNPALTDKEVERTMSEQSGYDLAKEVRAFTNFVILRNRVGTTVGKQIKIKG